MIDLDQMVATFPAIELNRAWEREEEWRTAFKASCSRSFNGAKFYWKAFQCHAAVAGQTIGMNHGRPESSSVVSKARALRMARKLEREGRPRLSGGADPGPSGFDWKELKRTEDFN